MSLSNYVTIKLSIQPIPIPTPCGRCSRLHAGNGWCAECEAEELRLVALHKVDEDAWEVYVRPPHESGPVTLAASCTSFDSALAAARLLRGRLSYPAFERRLSRADDAWEEFCRMNPGA